MVVCTEQFAAGGGQHQQWWLDQQDGERERLKDGNKRTVKDAEKGADDKRSKQRNNTADWYLAAADQHLQPDIFPEYVVSTPSRYTGWSSGEK